MPETENIFARLPDIQKEPRFSVQVKDVRETAPGVLLLTLERPPRFTFSPGQYVWLVLPRRTKRHGVVDRRAYSIASGTEAKELELLVRLSGSDFTAAVKELKKKETVYLIGPMGSQFIPPAEGAALISGGVGIAPFLSILRSHTKGDFSLHAFEDPDRPLYCKEEVQQLAADNGYSVTFTRGKAHPKSFGSFRKNLGSRPVFIAGPQGFIDTVDGIMRELRVSAKHVRYEANHPISKNSAALFKAFERINDSGELEHQIERLDRSTHSLRGLNVWSAFGEGSGAVILNWVVYSVFVSVLISGILLFTQTGRVPMLHLLIAPFIIILVVWRYFGGDIKKVGQGVIAWTFVATLASRFSASSITVLEPWVLIFPVVMRKLTTFKQALWWNIAFMLALAGIAGLGVYGVFGIPRPGESTAQLMLALAFISIIMNLYTYREEQREILLENTTKARERLVGDMNETLRLSEIFVKISGQTTNHVVLTDNNGRVLYANKAAEELTGYTFEEMRGQTPRLWGGLLTRENYGHLWGKKDPKAVKQAHPVLNRNRSGRLYVALGRIVPLYEGKEVIAYAATEEDVTTLMNIDKTKSEFVSLASHQLRTPLSAINWYSEMMLSGDAGKLSLEQEKYMQEIYDGSQRMVNLVNSLLNVSRIDLGTFIVEPQMTSIVALVRSVMDEQKPTIDAKGLDVTPDIAADVPDMNVDPKLLRMVFQNLLSNAVKYTPEKGAITMTLEVRKKGEALDNTKLKEDSLCFTIKDTGCGIPKSQQQRIFSKLFRADNAKEVDTTGTGLGLYIIKSILDNSGGDIWFESEENEGTTFYVTLPLTGMTKHEGTRELG